MFPETVDNFRTAGADFALELGRIKQQVEVPDYGWYPYQTMTTVPLISDLLAPVFDEVRDAILDSPVADIGCGDGDLAMFFARLGSQVDAVDHAESNFNQFRGAETLRRELSLAVNLCDVDLDGAFVLPRPEYGLALLLGTLYHLKNPFFVLEKIAACADWCILSTRIAQITAANRTHIEGEPVAYLLGAREANNDPTNFWIFSFTGLRRLLERAGWIVMGHTRLGCLVDSDPVRPDADERVILIVKSRTRHPDLHIRLLEGWYPPENDAFRWTAKQFSVEMTLPADAKEFALRFFVPEVALASGAVRISCLASGQQAGSITCETSDQTEFRGHFQEGVTAVRLEFKVETAFVAPGDRRELGVCVPLLDPSHRSTQRLPFRIS